MIPDNHYHVKGNIVRYILFSIWNQKLSTALPGCVVQEERSGLVKKFRKIFGDSMHSENRFTVHRIAAYCLTGERMIFFPSLLGITPDSFKTLATSTSILEGKLGKVMELFSCTAGSLDAESSSKISDTVDSPARP